MDVVTDLTTQAVSYLSIVQDICKSSFNNTGLGKLNDLNKWKAISREDVQTDTLTHAQVIKISELIWFSKGSYDKQKVVDAFCESVLGLLGWLADNIEKRNTDHALIFNSPFFWRQKIRDILYEEKNKRLELSRILHYMPLQPILALSPKGCDRYNVRLYQVFEAPKEALISKRDEASWKSWWTVNKANAEKLLVQDGELLKMLIDREFPLPFETLLGTELNEIHALRGARINDMKLSGVPLDKSQVFDATNGAEEVQDPFKRASHMKLAGLALSGGGIRSATFSLGVVQKLASMGVLHRFDYLSTVSGGGYIGTWLSAWVMRSASLRKVTDRLCPDASGDPMADEVRPIRWLRMFSNYLSPNVGIMSSDAWASGVTWLRNTMINQLLLLLVFICVLSFITDAFNAWEWLAGRGWVFNTWAALGWSALILIPGALIIALAMRSYYTQTVENTDKKKSGADPRSVADFTNRQVVLPDRLLAWSTCTALLITTWLHALNTPTHWLGLWPGGLVCFIAMLVVAFGGNYHKRRDLKALGRSNLKGMDRKETTDRFDKRHENYTLFGILISSVIASVAFMVLLWLGWAFIQQVGKAQYAWLAGLNARLTLLLSMPVVMEVLSLTVIVRMIVMGNLRRSSLPQKRIKASIAF